MSKQLTVTISDDALYSAIAEEAKQTARSPDEIIEEALRDWLDAQADSAEEGVIRERMASYRADGGIELEEILKERGLKP